LRYFKRSFKKIAVITDLVCGFYGSMIYFNDLVLVNKIYRNILILDREIK